MVKLDVIFKTLFLAHDYKIAQGGQPVTTYVDDTIPPPHDVIQNCSPKLFEVVRLHEKMYRLLLVFR